MMNGLRLPQMQGAGHEAVLLASANALQRSWAVSMSDPRTGGVAQAPKTRHEEWR